MALLIAGPAEAASARLWAKIGTPAAAMQADLDDCTKNSQGIRAHYATPAVYPTSVAGAVAAAVVLGVMAGVQEHKAKVGYVRRCMRAHGYVGVPLTPAEESEAKGFATPAEKAGWTDRLYATPAFSDRLDTAGQPRVPPLTEAAPEPLAYGGVRIDPAVLSVASNVVVAGGGLLGGKISHRRTGRLATGIDLETHLPLHADAGAVFHQVLLPGEDDPQQTYWCGPMTSQRPLTGPKPMVGCVWIDEDGYAIGMAEGAEWLAADVPPSDKALRWKSADATFVFAESDEDLLGPLDFALVVRKVGKTAVSLEADASHDGKFVAFWVGEESFDAQGKAVLPFWTHRLVMTRSGDGVTAAFTADGDGQGWPDPPGS